jgi:endonuclease-3
MLSLRARARRISHRLRMVYGDGAWRASLPALDELVSTILSQNTNDLNRDRAFAALKQALPTWEEVRDAPCAGVSAAIRRPGYRAPSASHPRGIAPESRASAGSSSSSS